jgi:hypothetical protein
MVNRSCPLMLGEIVAMRVDIITITEWARI